MIRAVIFDIDGTVYDYTSADKTAWTVLERYCEQRLAIGGDKLQRYVSQARSLADRRTGTDCAAAHNRLIRFQCMLELLGKPLFPYAYEMYSLYWDTLIGAAEPEPGVVGLMAALKERGTYIGVGTNMTADIQYRKIERLGLGGFIDGMVTSEETGVEKPDVRLFRLCAEKAGAVPSECVFVGDSVKHDIEGAHRAGMKAILYAPAKTEPESGPTFRVSEVKKRYPVIRSFEQYFAAEKECGRLV